MLRRRLIIGCVLIIGCITGWVVYTQYSTLRTPHVSVRQLLEQRVVFDPPVVSPRNTEVLLSLSYDVERGIEALPLQYRYVHRKYWHAIRDNRSYDYCTIGFWQILKQFDQLWGQLQGSWQRHYDARYMLDGLLPFVPSISPSGDIVVSNLSGVMVSILQPVEEVPIIHAEGVAYEVRNIEGGGNIVYATGNGGSSMQLFDRIFRDDQRLMASCIERLDRFVDNTAVDLSRHDDTSHMYYLLLYDIFHATIEAPYECVVDFPLDETVVNENVAFLRSSIAMQKNWLDRIVETIQKDELAGYYALCDALDDYEMQQQYNREEYDDWEDDFDIGEVSDTQDTSLTPLQESDQDMVDDLRYNADEWVQTMWQTHDTGVTFDDLLEIFFSSFNGKTG